MQSILIFTYLQHAPLSHEGAHSQPSILANWLLVVTGIAWTGSRATAQRSRELEHCFVVIIQKRPADIGEGKLFLLTLQAVIILIHKIFLLNVLRGTCTSIQVNLYLEMAVKSLLLIAFERSIKQFEKSSNEKIRCQ